MLKNLRLVWKLVLPFGLLIILMLGIALFAFHSISMINDQIVMYRDGIVPSTSLAWQVRRDMVSVQRYLLMSITETEKSVVQSYLQNVEIESQRITSNIAQFGELNYEAKASADKLLSIVEQMDPYRAAITELVSGDDSDKETKAYVIFKTDYKPLVEEATGILDALTNAITQTADLQSQTAKQNYINVMINSTVVLGVAVLFCVIVVVSLRKAFTPPMTQVVRGARNMAMGKMDYEITYSGRDEFGDMAKNMRELSVTIKDIISDMGVALHEISNGDFTGDIKKQELYVGAFEPLKNSIREIINQLTMTLRQIDQATDQFLCTSEQVAQSAQMLSDGATQQASAIQQIAAAVTQISSKVKRNADNAREATAMVKGVEGEVVESNNHMQEMINAMNKISETSSEIGKVIKTIQDIAFQTNILALNAAVEAARAGEAGKGFAVVADEVRNLASKSADAAKGTTELIQGAITAVGNGTKIADATAKSLLAVVEGTKAVTATVNDIANASDEQADQILEVTQGVDSISAVIQTNSSTAEESAATSEELSSQAQMLRALVLTFKLKKEG